MRLKGWVKAPSKIHRVKGGHYWIAHSDECHCDWCLLIRPVWNGWLAGKWISWN